MGKFKLIDGIESAGSFTIVDSKDVSYTEEKTVKQVLDEQEYNEMVAEGGNINEEDAY